MPTLRPRTRNRPPGGWHWYAPHRAILLVGLIVTLIALAGAFLGVANATQAESLTAQMSTALSRAPGSGPESPRVRGGLPGPGGEGVQRRRLAGGDCGTGARGGDRRPGRQQVLHQPGAPPHHLGRHQPGSAPGAPAWPRSSRHRTASVPSWPAGRRRRRPRSWPRWRKRRRQTSTRRSPPCRTPSAPGSSPPPTRPTRPPAVPGTELLWSIVIGVAIAGTVRSRSSPATRFAVEHEQADRDAVQSDIAQRIAFKSACNCARDVDGGADRL